ncbi:MAG: hypothetical protein FJ148_16060 [Deltaproteobacteria bacterium]|nr:hypothetical protein [Deltaproteobacteria bacterium]
MAANRKTTNPERAGNRPSLRSEVVYNFEPFRGAVREGDWKLVWKTLTPASVEPEFRSPRWKSLGNDE